MPPAAALTAGMLALASTWDEGVVSLVAAAIATEFKVPVRKSAKSLPWQQEWFRLLALQDVLTSSYRYCSSFLNFKSVG